jgi:hypothetical protein
MSDLAVVCCVVLSSALGPVGNCVHCVGLERGYSRTWVISGRIHGSIGQSVDRA